MTNTLDPLNFISSVGDRSIALGIHTFRDFLSFLTEKNILNLAVATTIGFYINGFTSDIMDIIGKPIINKILNKAGDIETKYIVTLFGIKFEIGRLIEVIFKLIVTLFIIYMIYRFLPQNIPYQFS